MRILERPKEKPKGLAAPSWWRTFGKEHGTIVEHRGHVWRLRRDSVDGWAWWDHVSTIGAWSLRQIEATVEARRERVPKRGPRGRAGDSGASPV